MVQDSFRSKRKGAHRSTAACCFHPAVRDPPVDVNVDTGNVDGVKKKRVPTHLVVTVNGIIGSAGNWRYAAKQFVNNYPEEIIVHCSESNYASLTFDGVDVMGERLASEIPLFRGSHALEKMACHISWIAGRTGKHLFLKDRQHGKPPLLLQMVSDHGDLQFMSALHAFQRRTTYSNVCSDFIVGWNTSSIRRRHELPKRKFFMKNESYPHIVYEEKANVGSIRHENFVGTLISKIMSAAEMEEVMIEGLNRVSWERVDVSFRKSKQRIFAHSTIQVKTYSINSDGADVIFHMIDNFVL